MADVELGNMETQTSDPAPPILEHAKLGHLYLFQEELRTSSHPLDFRAGPAVYSDRTPLHLAAMHGHHDIVQFILNHPGITRDVVNAKDCFGYTPLHLAVWELHESVVKLLTESLLVFPDRFLTTNSHGYTPLHFTFIKESPDIARLLLRQHCQVQFSHDPVNIHAASGNGLTPLDLARMKKIEELVESLEGSDQNWLQQERDKNAMAANAILVGAALVAATAFGSYVQPPGGIPTTDFASPSASPSLGKAERVDQFFFHSYVVVAFYFSVFALAIGTYATMPDTTVTLKVEVQQLRVAVRLARMCLLLAILDFLRCFFMVSDMKLPINSYFPLWVLVMIGFISSSPRFCVFVYMCQISIPFEFISQRNAFFILG